MTATELTTHRPPAGRPQLGCQHFPQCPSDDAPDHDAPRIVASHPEQGWNLLCNGVVVFEDTGEILPDRTCVAPRRPSVHQPLRAA
jgi:hypothetical protein